MVTRAKYFGPEYTALRLIDSMMTLTLMPQATAKEPMYNWIHLTYDLNNHTSDRNLKWAEHTTGHLLKVVLPCISLRQRWEARR